MSAQPFWTPSEAEVNAAEMTKFRLYVNERYGLKLDSYWDLWRWSTGTPMEMNDFWTAVWDFTGILGEQGPAPVSNSSRVQCGDRNTNTSVSCFLCLFCGSYSTPAYQSMKPDASVPMPASTGQRTYCWGTSMHAQKRRPPLSR